jgi:hypothetical protein
MKKLLLMFCIAITNMVFAERIVFPVSEIGLQTGLNQLTLTQTQTALTTTSTQRFTNIISEIELEKNTIQEQSFTTLNLGGYVRNGEVGDPNLLGKTKLLTPPKGTTIEIRVLSSQYMDISLNTKGFTHPLMPVEPPHRKSDPEVPTLIKNAEAYAKTSFNQRDLVDFVHFGTMRDEEVFRLNISPIQYLPAENIIRVHYHIEFEVIYVGAMHASPKNPAKAPIYKVVSHQMFENSSLSQFMQWKTDQGFDVQVSWYDYSGTTVAQATEFRIDLKNYLWELYSDLETRPDYILFVGDHQQIPAWPHQANFSGQAAHVTDLYYVVYDPDGFLPNIPYGRLPHQTVQTLNNHIEKILATDQMTGNLDHFTRSVQIAGSESTWRWRQQADVTVDYAADNYFNPSYGITSTVIKNPLSDQDHTIAQPSRDAISTGAIFVNYSSHCNQNQWDKTVLRVADAHNLTNRDMYPLMIGNCCISAGFHYDECIGEALVRGYRKGASTYIGATNNTYWHEDFSWSIGPMSQYLSDNPTVVTIDNTGLGAFDRLFSPNYDERSKTMYDIIRNGNITVTLSESWSGPTYYPRMIRYYWEIYHVFGDPSMVPSFGPPQTMSINVDTVIMFTDQEWVIQTVPHARVGFTFNGKLLASAKADEAGVATLVFTEELPIGEAKLVITAGNYSPHIAPITILRYPTSIASPLSEQVGFDVMIRGNGQLHVQINTETPIQATIRLSNAGGQPVRMIASNKTLNAGKNDFYFDMSHLPRGIYICTFFDGKRMISQKIVW